MRKKKRRRPGYVEIDDEDLERLQAGVIQPEEFWEGCLTTLLILAFTAIMVLGWIGGC